MKPLPPRLRAFGALFFFLAAFPAPAFAQMALYVGGGDYKVPVRTWRDIPFRTVVRQQYDYSCGSAALATLLRYHYGRTVGEAQIFKAMYLSGNQASIRKVGFSLLDMKKYLAGIGLASDGYRTDLAAVRSAGIPAITVITVNGYKHFVVIKGIDNSQVLVGDPALGLRKISIADFKKMWNGIIFEIHDGHGAAKPVFNASNEWKPWATAPFGQEMDRESLMNITANIPTIYQIVQLTPMRPD